MTSYAVDAHLLACHRSSQPPSHTHTFQKKKIELDWFSHTDCKALTTLSALLCGQGQLPVVVKGAKGTHADFSLRKATKPQYDSTKATRLLLSLTRGDSMVTAPLDQVDSSTHYSRFDHDPESIRSHPWVNSITEYRRFIQCNDAFIPLCV